MTPSAYQTNSAIQVKRLSLEVAKATDPKHVRSREQPHSNRPQPKPENWETPLKQSHFFPLAMCLTQPRGVIRAADHLLLSEARHARSAEPRLQTLGAGTVAYLAFCAYLLYRKLQYRLLHTLRVYACYS